MLRHTLEKKGLDLQHCFISESEKSGIGLVLLQPTGEVSCIVAPNSNIDWKVQEICSSYKNQRNKIHDDENSKDILQKIMHSSPFPPIKCIMLQMEIPHNINVNVLKLAEKYGIPTFHDLGGEERSAMLNQEYLQRCTYLSPNLTELRRYLMACIDHNLKKELKTNSLEMVEKRSTNPSTVMENKGEEHDDNIMSSSKAVHVIVIKEVPICNQEKWLQMAKLLAKETWKENGCETYSFIRSKNSSTRFIIVEKWESQDHLEAHFKTAHFKHFVPIMDNISDTVSLEINTEIMSKEDMLRHQEVLLNKNKKITSFSFDELKKNHRQKVNLMQGRDNHENRKLIQLLEDLLKYEKEANFDELANTVVLAAEYLQSRGAQNILVTMGSLGCVLVTKNGIVHKQPSMPLPPHLSVMDETGAGDNFRAAFVVSHFLENKTLPEALAFASASGCLSVTKMGAMTSATHEDCTYFLNRVRGGNDSDRKNTSIPVSSSLSSSSLISPERKSIQESSFPFQFASRLNSMKDWDPSVGLNSWIQQQGKIKGLDLVDFNYPQHLTGPVTDDYLQHIQQMLKSSGLQAGTICLRFPKFMQKGAYTNPDPSIRKQAIQLTKEACEWAKRLGSNEICVWSAFDGYDYPLQVDYDKLWDQIKNAFQEVCDSFPSVKVSLEFKPTDENTRFFTVPSTAAAILLLKEVNRENFGLTLDFGHCLMAGENPAQSIAMVQKCSKSNSSSGGKSPSKLFGLQLGDGYGRLGAEDGLMFGSINTLSALELVIWLIKTNYDGHIYFDTFPRNEDPIRECEYNIRRFKNFYRKARLLLEGKDAQKFKEMLENHDAMGILEYLENFQE